MNSLMQRWMQIKLKRWGASKYKMMRLDKPLSKRSYWKYMGILLPIYFLEILLLRNNSGSFNAEALSLLSLIIYSATLMITFRRLKTTGGKIGELFALVFGSGFLIVVIMTLALSNAAVRGSNNQSGQIYTPIIMVLLIGAFLIPFIVVGTRKSRDSL